MSRKKKKMDRRETHIIAIKKAIKSTPANHFSAEVCIPEQRHRTAHFRCRNV